MGVIAKTLDVVEPGLEEMVTRLSDRAAVAMAVTCYVAGLALPLALHWSKLALVESNLCGASLAAVLGLAWFVAGVRASQRRLLVEWTSDLHLLNAEEFEWFVGEVFRRDGWQVKETGCQDAADGNIDLELTRDGKRMVAQCKRWTARPVGVGVVREFAGTLLREGLVGSDGLFVTLSDFTSQARSEAAKMGMVLVDKRDLYARAEKVRHSEDCPDCSTPMVLARSHRGWWMRCVASGCAGKRDLGNDPARAVDLLLQQA